MGPCKLHKHHLNCVFHVAETVPSLELVPCMLILA